MKQLLTFLFMFAVTMATAQHTVPRFSSSSGGTLNQPAFYYSIKDTAGATDTAFIRPTAYRNVFNINANDTLKGHFVIVLNDTVRGKITNVRNLSYEDDNMSFYFKSGTVTADTIYFYGYIQTGATATTFTKQTLPVPARRQGSLSYHFNGSAWIGETTYLISY